MLKSDKFYCKNSVTYPPFKEGRYMEEFFLQKIDKENINTKRKYIPALWTNFQIEGWFNNEKNNMQKVLDEWVKDNPSINGYFTVVQYDDACLLTLPENTIVYGSCSGDIPIPLIYEDVRNKLENYKKFSYQEKKILCSFVGAITSNNIEPNVRLTLYKKLKKNKNYKFYKSTWTDKVEKSKQDLFEEVTANSKFCLAPRGYGRSSFRFFESFKLGTIPIYVWNDKNWLPFQDKIDYSKICIVIHVSEINSLTNILTSIDEEKYNQMFEEYNKVKNLFTLEGMSNEIINNINT